MRRFEQVKKSLMRIPEVERTAMMKADVFRKYTVTSKYFDTIFKLVQTKLLSTARSTTTMKYGHIIALSYRGRKLMITVQLLLVR